MMATKYIQTLPIQMNAVEGDLKVFITSNNTESASTFLRKKTLALKAGNVSTLTLDCADARVVVPHHFGCEEADKSVVYSTAAQAITDETIHAIMDRFPSLQKVHIYGHEFCGGCGVKAMLEKGDHNGLTPELEALGDSLTSADPYHNAEGLAARFVKKGLLAIPYLAKISDGCLCGDHGTVRPEGYKSVLGNWDMKLGQNPKLILLNLGLDYSGTEYVFGTALDDANTIFDVSVPHFDQHARASLQYALSHAMKHTTNEAGHSFNNTATFIVMTSVDKEVDALAALEELNEDMTWQEFMSSHEETGLKGRTYLCLHKEGVMKQVREIVVE
jgi:hypothetical protein